MKTIMRMGALVMAGMVSPTETILAQEPALTQNSEIKVVLEDGRELRGEFREWIDEGLALNAQLGWGSRTFRAYERGEVKEIWLKTGETSVVGHRLGGVVKITGIAALVGAGMGYLSCDDPDGLIRRDGYALIGAIALATPVAAIGLISALLAREDVWSPVTPAWERSGKGGDPDRGQSVGWSAGITPDGRLGLGLTFRR
jgi:hypothetical protein